MFFYNFSLLRWLPIANTFSLLCFLSFSSSSLAYCSYIFSIVLFHHFSLLLWLPTANTFFSIVFYPSPLSIASIFCCLFVCFPIPCFNIYSYIYFLLLHSLFIIYSSLPHPLTANSQPFPLSSPSSTSLHPPLILPPSISPGKERVIRNHLSREELGGKDRISHDKRLKKQP